MLLSQYLNKVYGFNTDEQKHFQVFSFTLQNMLFSIKESFYIYENVSCFNDMKKELKNYYECLGSLYQTIANVCEWKSKNSLFDVYILDG